MSGVATTGVLVKNADRLKTTVDAYNSAMNVNTALDVAQAFSQFIGVAAVAGLSEPGISKVLQKTGLERVFDSLKKGKSFQDYLEKQNLAKDVGAASIAVNVDYAITSFNENSDLGILSYDMINEQEKLDAVQIMELNVRAHGYFHEAESTFYKSFNKWSSDALLNNANNLFGALTPTYNFDLSGFDHNPIGAFYDSRTQATDTAASIADRTFTLIDATHCGISAHELSLRDANRDGQLTGNELASLFIWTMPMKTATPQSTKFAPCPSAAL